MINCPVLCFHQIVFALFYHELQHFPTSGYLKFKITILENISMVGPHVKKNKHGECSMNDKDCMQLRSFCME